MAKTPLHNDACLRKLEEFRNQPYVGENAFLTPYCSGKPLPNLFHNTANGAFYMTIDALNRMQSRESIGGNECCVPAISLWFQSTESYISTLYKIAQEESTAKVRTIKETRKILEKFDELNSYLSTGTSQAPQLRNRIQEFATFRNILFHDLTMVKTPQYSHTLFSRNADKLNEVDLFQSLLIAIDTFSYYRHALKGVDLMPQIYINNQFGGLDILAKEILFPSFGDILMKKGLSTKLQLAISLEIFSHEFDVTITPIISYQGPAYPIKCEVDPKITREYLKKAEEARPISSTHFKVPNYMRKPKTSPT
jgi:hypothetical protein